MRLKANVTIAACWLALAQGSIAQDIHKGHAMPAADAADPHAGHKMNMKSEVMRSEVALTIPATPLLRTDGSNTTLLKELSGNKPTVVAFFYTSCTTVCPVTNQILSNTQDALGKDLAGVRILSFSIDPEQDTPTVLKAYQQKFGAKPQWQMYTGTMQNSVAVQKVFGAYRGDKMNHEPFIFVNTGGNKSWVQLRGFPSAEQVVKELNLQKRG